MSEQNSQKQGLKSSGQKEARARDGYKQLPASAAVGGAYGKQRRTKQTDEELSLGIDQKRSMPGTKSKHQKGRKDRTSK